MTPDGNDGRSPGTTRRGVLAGAAGFAAGLSSTTAGCLAGLPPLNQRIRYGRVDTPEPDEPDYRRWVPAPGALEAETDLAPTKRLMSATPRRAGRDVVGQRITLFDGVLVGQLDYFGIGYENYDRVVGVGHTIVAEADVDRESVASVATGSGYEAVGSYSGYDLYERGGPERTVAVGDEAIVLSLADASTAAIEAVVDASAGRIDRFHERDEGFARLTRAAGSSPSTLIADGALSMETALEPRWTAISATFDDESVYYTETMLFPDGADVSKRRVRDALEDSGRALRSTNVDVGVDGRLSTVEMQLPHETYLERWGREYDLVPQITWGFDHDPDRETLEIAHEAGDPVDAAALELTYAGDWELPDQFADEHETVTPGDALVVDVSSRPSISPVQLTYRPEGSDTRLYLYGYEFE